MSTSNASENLQQARQLLITGKVSQAIRTLEQIEQQSAQHHVILQQVAELYLQCGQYERAAACYRQCVELQPHNPAYLYNLAASVTSFGDIEQAGSLYEKVLQLAPGDYGAYLNRSGLRKQTPESNHTEELESLKNGLSADDPGHIPLCYSLAKELEDLERSEASFNYLQEGSHRRRLGMQYDVAADESAMTGIANHFDETLFSRPRDSGPDQRPVFILGLPRSGSTLVDRIVGSHSATGSLGEHNMLPFVLMDQLGLAPDREIDRLELIRRSATVDFADTGQRYCAAVEGFGNPAPRLIDKTPLNFLYLGLIHLALPGARIIHTRRTPLDSCYAIYKTLFRAGYPFSYSLQELGRYYIAYHRLMAHWRRVIPGAFLDVDYEAMVRDPEAESRRILNYLELDWEPGCMDFHRRSGAAATASATQVRQPVYSTSVGLWRRYEKQLAPFAAKLNQHGIDIEAAA